MLNKYMVTLTYLVAVEADSAMQASIIAQQEVTDDKWYPNDVEIEIWEPTETKGENNA